MAQEGYYHLLYDVCMQCLVMKNFWPLYSSFDGCILLTATIYYFRRLYITFNGYILLLALLDCDFVRIQDFLAISHIYGLKASYQFVRIYPVLIFYVFQWFLL